MLAPGCVMPLYDLFCLARPALARDELFSIIKRSCSTVLAGSGVITDIKYNGVTTLAYTIKKTHGHYPEVRTCSHAASSCCTWPAAEV